VGVNKAVRTRCRTVPGWSLCTWHATGTSAGFRPSAP